MRVGSKNLFPVLGALAQFLSVLVQTGYHPITFSDTNCMYVCVFLWQDGKWNKETPTLKMLRS